jgi:hypothetical protein
VAVVIDGPQSAPRSPGCRLIAAIGRQSISLLTRSISIPRGRHPGPISAQPSLWDTLKCNPRGWSASRGCVRALTQVQAASKCSRAGGKDQAKRAPGFHEAIEILAPPEPARPRSFRIGYLLQHQGRRNFGEV